ncbi:phosphatidylserine/phosphatidylglycerophosphate/cardiolipin synthase family protein [Polaromonas sp.]|uniref:phospholipase D-like domain-containing protein n=1 Tax=Polaromonas sp. TaxID=1869339 RepID=UPI003523799A
MMKKNRPVLTILLTFLITVAGVLLVLNFSTGETKVNRELPRLYATQDPQFRRAMGALLGPALVGGNRARELLNGDQIFPAMLQAIHGAQRSITFETYIYWSGDVGRQFADALAERARAGVKVHVLLDWVGSSKIDASFLQEMETAGVEIRKFHKPHWYNWGRMNNRTHRKLLVVDGGLGFTGGVGIAPQWTGNGQDADHWRDSHFSIEGPAVAQMQAVFMDNWLKVTGRVMHGEAYFPALAPAGNSRAQVFSSSPSGGSESMQLMYLLSITAAARSIDLSSAYFVPDELTSKALTEALKRGVKLRIITPGEIIDTDTVRAASRGSWGPLLRAGAEIYEYQPSMYHVKAMVVDQLLVSVGSTNFDNRSFRLNDEANLNVFDADFAKRQTQVFEDDLKRARRITYEQWEARPLKEKIMERLALLLESQL